MADADGHHALARRLGFWSAIGLVVGITIGSGIFRTPASVAARVPDPAVMLGVWLAGGLVALAGALSVAELAAALPYTGGWYVYLREAWGRLAGFLFGWSELVLIRATANGAIATVFAEYFLRSVGRDPSGGNADYVAVAALVGAAAINIRGVRIGAAVAGLSSLAKFTALVLLVGASVALGGDAGASVAHFSRDTGPVTVSMLGLALVSVLWAYDGFADVSFATGEVRDPRRTLPRAIVVGTLAIITIYLAANVAYLYVNSPGSMATSPLIAADTAQALLGNVGATIVSVVVAVSTLGSLMGIMLTAPRVFFAMADDRLFFPAIARVHPKYGTPHVAIALSAGLGVLFVLTRTFEQLADTFVLTVWPFYGLAIAGVYRLRRMHPDVPRAYSVPGYPLTPAIFILAVVFLVGSAFVSNPIWTGMTFGIVLLGIPVYFVAFRRSS